MNADRVFGLYWRVRDLPERDRTERTLPNGATITGRPVVLRCPACFEQFSAARGDYWQRDPDEVLRCNSCNDTESGEPLQVVRERISYDVFTPGDPLP